MTGGHRKALLSTSQRDEGKVTREILKKAKEEKSSFSKSSSSQQKKEKRREDEDDGGSGENEEEEKQEEKEEEEGRGEVMGGYMWITRHIMLSPPILPIYERRKESLFFRHRAKRQVEATSEEEEERDTGGVYPLSLHGVSLLLHLLRRHSPSSSPPLLSLPLLPPTISSSSSSPCISSSSCWELSYRLLSLLGIRPLELLLLLTDQRIFSPSYLRSFFLSLLSRLKNRRASDQHTQPPLILSSSSSSSSSSSVPSTTSSSYESSSSSSCRSSLSSSYLPSCEEKKASYHCGVQTPREKISPKRLRSACEGRESHHGQPLVDKKETRDEEEEKEEKEERRGGRYLDTPHMKREGIQREERKREEKREEEEEEKDKRYLISSLSMIYEEVIATCLVFSVILTLVSPSSPSLPPFSLSSSSSSSGSLSTSDHQLSSGSLSSSSSLVNKGEKKKKKIKPSDSKQTDEGLSDQKTPDVPVSEEDVLRGRSRGLYSVLSWIDTVFVKSAASPHLKKGELANLLDEELIAALKGSWSYLMKVRGVSEKRLLFFLRALTEHLVHPNLKKSETGTRRKNNVHVK
ncbi:hypothetical protein CSUI_005013, partial [Cystoisospora suis]